MRRSGGTALGVAERRERERRERRQAILGGAARLLRERPYDAVLVGDIAAAAEVAKGTVYLYFPDKDAILAELAADTLGRLRAAAAGAAAEVRAGGLPALVGIRRVVTAWPEAYFAEPWLFRALVLDRPRLLATGLAEGGGGLLAPLEEIVELGRRRGEVAPGADARVLSQSLWALFVGGLLLERRGELDSADIRAEGAAVLMALVQGFCTAAKTATNGGEAGCCKSS